MTSPPLYFYKRSTPTLVEVQGEILIILALPKRQGLLVRSEGFKELHFEEVISRLLGNSSLTGLGKDCPEPCTSAV
jgi:hypothetical protein